MFDYFYGNEHEQYIHLQVPMILIKDPTFKQLSGDAKLLYGLLLNRTSLSIRNNWHDEQGRVYIIYTIEEMQNDLNCSEKKAINLTKELKRVELIETVRRGLNKPNLIYVKNFATVLKYEKDSSNPVDTGNCNFDSSLNCNFDSSRTNKKNVQEHTKLQAIYNDFKKDLQISYNDSNHIESYQESNEKNEKEKTDTIRLDKTITQAMENEKEQKNKESFENATAIQSNQAFTKPSTIKYSVAEVEETIKENINYDYILMDEPNCKEMLDGVLHVIVSTIMTNFKDGYISMKDESVPAELVKSVFFKLTKEDIEYFIENFNRQTDPTIKLTPYIRTSLYRNHGTNGFYWKNRVNVDMPQLAERKIHNKRE